VGAHRCGVPEVTAGVDEPDDRVRAAYAVVATGERRLYGNLVLRKGVVRPD